MKTKILKNSELILEAITDVRTCAERTGIALTDNLLARVLSKVITEYKDREVTNQELMSELFTGFQIASVIEQIHPKRAYHRKTKTDAPEMPKRPVGRPRKHPLATTTMVDMPKRPVGRPRKKIEQHLAVNGN